MNGSLGRARKDQQCPSEIVCQTQEPRHVPLKPPKIVENVLPLDKSEWTDHQKGFWAALAGPDEPLGPCVKVEVGLFQGL